MATTQGEASTGSETLQVDPKTALRIVMGLTAQGAKELLVDNPKLLQSVWSEVKDADPDKCLKGLLVGSTFVAATSLVGMGMRKLWTWLTIESISTGSVIYHVSVPTTRVVELQRLVDSGEMKKSLDEILHNPKKFLEDRFLKQHEIDKALDALPEELTISSLQIRKDNKSAVAAVEADDQSSSKATGKRSADAVPVVGTADVKGSAYVGGEGNYIDKRKGAAARLPQLKQRERSSRSSDKDAGEARPVVGHMTVGKELYADQKDMVVDEREDGKILVRVIVPDLDETFKREFQRTDLVFDVLGALKKKTGKEYRLQIAETKKKLERHESLDDAGVADGTVLEAIPV